MFNFNVIYFLFFLFTSIFAFSQYSSWDEQFLFYYVILAGLFFFSFSITYSFFRSRSLFLNHCNVKTVPSSRILVRYAFILFCVSQIYYSNYLYVFLTGGPVNDYLSHRIAVRGMVNRYLAPLGFSSFMLSVGYLLWAISEEHSNKDERKGYIRVKKLIMYLFLFVSIVFIEISVSGSRSEVLIVLCVIVLFLFKYRMIKYKSIIALVLLIMPLLGFVSYLRVSANPNRLAWYMTNQVISAHDSPLIIAFSMIMLTFKGIGERTILIVEGVLNGMIPHQYGYASFFYLFSMMPGEQMRPTVWLNHNVFYGANLNAGYPPTIIAQLLWDFGVIGIPIIGLILGSIGGILFKNYKKNVSPAWVIAYALFVGQCFLSLYGEFRIGWLMINVFIIVFIDLYVRGIYKFKGL